MKLLSEKELHQLAMTTVGEHLEQEGFEFMTVNSQLKKDPQFVCLKNKKLHFVVVRAVRYPKNPIEFDVAFMEKMRVHATTFKAHTYYAGVGLAHGENYELPLTVGAPYAINFQGLQEIVDHV
jgi:hypothetical protein